MTKQRKLAIAAAALAIILAAVGIRQALRPRALGDEPPTLTVSAGAAEISAPLTNYHWMGIACGPHPLECRDTAPVIAQAGLDRLGLSFDGPEPTSVEASWWCFIRGQTTGCGMADGTVTPEGMSSLPLSDGWCAGSDAAVFCLRAVWDESHSAEYVFVVEP